MERLTNSASTTPAARLCQDYRLMVPAMTGIEPSTSRQLARLSLGHSMAAISTSPHCPFLATSLRLGTAPLAGRSRSCYAQPSPGMLAPVTNVPHYAEARRSRVPCQPKPSGCYQALPGLIVPYPFGPFWSSLYGALGWCRPRAKAVKGQPPLRCRHTQLLSSFAKGALQRLPS